MAIQTDFLERSITMTETAYASLPKQEENALTYDLYRAACVKGFEISLEQSARLLRKALKPFFTSTKQVDRLPFKEVFRVAARHDLLSLDAVDRWLEYRDHRNSTAHEYGEHFAEALLPLMPHFIEDAKALCQAIKNTS